MTAALTQARVATLDLHGEVSYLLPLAFGYVFTRETNNTGNSEHFYSCVSACVDMVTLPFALLCR